MTFCPDVSLKTVTGSGGAISAALCLRSGQQGRRDEGWGGGGSDELLLDHACKLGPRGRVTFSRGTMEAAHSLPVLSSPQAPGVLVVFFFFSRSHMGSRFELDRELNHVPAAWMSWLCAEAQTVGYQIRARGLFFHSPFFRFSPSLSLFSITARPFLSCSAPPFPPSLPPLFGDGVTRESRLSAVGCPDNRENVPFLFASTSSE